MVKVKISEPVGPCVVVYSFEKKDCFSHDDLENLLVGITEGLDEAFTGEFIQSLSVVDYGMYFLVGDERKALGFVSGGFNVELGYHSAMIEGLKRRYSEEFSRVLERYNGRVLDICIRVVGARESLEETVDAQGPT